MSIREDLLTAAIRQFFNERIFGAGRRDLLAAQLPADAAERAARDQATTEALNQRLGQIEAAETAHAREIEALATETTAAVTALRTRILARFTGLEDERASITAQLARLDRDREPTPDLDLLDQLPVIGDLMAALPARLHAQVYEVLSLELLYSHDPRHALLRATITTSARPALAAIIRQCDTLTPALAATLSDWEHNPGTPETHRDHGADRAGEGAGPPRVLVGRPGGLSGFEDWLGPDQPA